MATTNKIFIGYFNVNATNMATIIECKHFFTYHLVLEDGSESINQSGGELTFKGAERVAEDMAEHMKEGEQIVIRDPKGVALVAYDCFDNTIYTSWTNEGQAYK